MIFWTEVLGLTLLALAIGIVMSLITRNYLTYRKRGMYKMKNVDVVPVKKRPKTIVRKGRVFVIETSSDVPSYRRLNMGPMQTDEYDLACTILQGHLSGVEYEKAHQEVLRHFNESNGFVETPFIVKKGRVFVNDISRGAHAYKPLVSGPMTEFEYRWAEKTLSELYEDEYNPDYIAAMEEVADHYTTQYNAKHDNFAAELLGRLGSDLAREMNPLDNIDIHSQYPDMDSLHTMIHPEHHKASGRDVWDITKDIIEGNTAWDKTDAMYFTFAFKHLPRCGMKRLEDMTLEQAKILDIGKSITYLQQWQKDLLEYMESKGEKK